MEFTKSQQLQEPLKNNFAFREKNSQRSKYFANYYQQHKEQKKRARRIKYQAQQLGLPKENFKLVGRVFGGEPKERKTQRDYNQTYYLKQKQTKLFLAELGQHTPYNQKEINKEKVNATKPILRDCGTILTNIQSILKKNKGGRPRSKEAQELGRALTSTERSQKRRARLKATKPFKWEKLLKDFLDASRVKIETRNKKPNKRGRPFKRWKEWVENKPVEKLLKVNGEWGARTGRQVKYYGRKYWFYWFDNDAMKKVGISTDQRKDIMTRNLNMCQKLGVAHVEGRGGLGMPILSKEPLPDFNIKYGEHTPAELLRNDRQAQIEGKGKKWNWAKPLIIKNAWSFCQILNRKENGWDVEEKDHNKSIKKIASNIKVYQQQEIQKNYNQLLRQYKENDTWQLQTTIINMERIKESWKGASTDPHIAYTNDFYFFLNAYCKTQAKLSEYMGQDIKIELKRGHSHIFLNRIC